MIRALLWANIVSLAKTRVGHLLRVRAFGLQLTCAKAGNGKSGCCRLFRSRRSLRNKPTVDAALCTRRSDLIQGSGRAVLVRGQLANRTRRCVGPPIGTGWSEYLLLSPTTV